MKLKRRPFLRLSLPLAVAGPTHANDAEGNGDHDGPGAEVTFGVIADPQYADLPEKWGRFYRNSPAKLKAAVAALNSEPLDFVVTLGDIIDAHFESFEGIMPLYRDLRAPHHAVPGNHDFEVDDARKDDVLPAMGIAEAFCSRISGGWRFLYLDGTDVSTWRHAAGDPRTAAAARMLEQLEEAGLPQAKPWNAAIGPAQLAWIEKELAAAKAAGQRVVVFNHFPVLPAGDSHNLWNAEELVRLIERHDHVAAYMNGHNHAGNYAEHAGCHYVNFKGMVETEHDTAFAVVRCFADRIEVEGHGLEPDRELG